MRSPRRGKSGSTEVDYSDIRDRVQDVDDFAVEYNIALYGRPGTGKTTLASTFPTPSIFLDCHERGTDSIRDVKGVKVLRARSWDEVAAFYWYLKDNPDKFKSCTVDTVSHVQSLAVRHVMMEKLGEDVTDARIGQWGTMTKQDWGKVSILMKEWILNMRDLSMPICFIAHEKTVSLDEEDQDPDDRIAPEAGPALSPSVASTLNAACGVIGNTFIRERIIKKKDKVTGKKVTERRVEYCLRVGPSSYYITKARKPRSVDVPEVIVDPEWGDIKELLGDVEAD